ncbi:hypothetical protein KCMC57_up55620 [Kitasatospora sp. CMC57]|uniref:Uncharacterized protein n=1 Tax=Kitasatospora sp. CMC57 TaxID=3231513 RepID=A0AB33K5R7_9ACTN
MHNTGPLTAKPKDMTCGRCNASVEAVYAGGERDGTGTGASRWTAGPCHNPQCSRTAKPRIGERQI